MIEERRYFQEKIDSKKKLSSTCEMVLSSDERILTYRSKFTNEYFKLGNINTITFSHQLLLDLDTGDFNISYKIENSNKINFVTSKSGMWNKNNDFKKLKNLCKAGFEVGEKKIGYWGMKYKKVVHDFYLEIKKEIVKIFPDEYIQKKIYSTSFIESILFDLIVDFHLTKKKIKFHDNVYNHIQEVFPQKKWLKQNENKFLPSILDKYGIKSKYFIGVLSSPGNEGLNIKCLSYLCKLFGDNYHDYIKKIEWEVLCKVHFNPVKNHFCKTESEKKTIVTTLLKWDKKIHPDNPLVVIYELFALREFLESKGYDFKIKVKSYDDIASQMESWNLIKRHLSVGFKWKYEIANDIIKILEDPIIINEKVFYPKIIASEDDFIMEGFVMKNCMSKQFLHGSIFLYMSLTYKCTRINVQYQKDRLIQGYGKANTPIKNEIFGDALHVLKKRLESFPTLSWKKEKYDIIEK